MSRSLFRFYSGTGFLAVMLLLVNGGLGWAAIDDDSEFTGVAPKTNAASHSAPPKTTASSTPTKKTTKKPSTPPKPVAATKTAEPLAPPPEKAPTPPSVPKETPAAATSLAPAPEPVVAPKEAPAATTTPAPPPEPVAAPKETPVTTEAPAPPPEPVAAPKETPVTTEAPAPPPEPVATPKETPMTTEPAPPPEPVAAPKETPVTTEAPAVAPTPVPEPPKVVTKPAADDPAAKEQVVVLDTTLGQIVIALDSPEAPKTCKNFRKLVAKGFYNKTVFHRVIPNFMIQGGDPNSKGEDRDTYGLGGPDYTLPPEILLTHTKGAVAMARLPDSVNPDRESNGSQFYICVVDCPSLDNSYTVFGHVLKGMDVVEAIANEPRDARDNPTRRIEMKAKLVPRGKALAE